MNRRLQKELQQSRPFPTLEEEVYVELQRTAQVAGRLIALVLRPWGLSESQFNVLRILRGSGPDGLPSSRIAERMVRHDPDLTRLVDQLEKRGLVEKSRDARDRRVVNSRITDDGTKIVEHASRKLREDVVAGLRHMSARKLESLADLLELARQGITSKPIKATPSPAPRGAAGTAPAARVPKGRAPRHRPRPPRAARSRRTR